MTWRKKVLAGSVLAGCSIAAFQPVVRNRLEHRLSEIFGARVEIGSSKLSLLDGTISLQQVVVHGPTGPSPAEKLSDGFDPSVGSNGPSIQLANVAMRFDWYSVLFRNLKVSNAIATGLDWHIEPPCAAVIPIADSRPNNLIQSPLQTLDPVPLKKSSETVVNRIIQPLRVFVTEEVAKQSQASFELSTTLQRMVERLDELQPNDLSINPLRQQQQQIDLDNIKKGLALVNQELADNRILKRKAESSLATLKQQSKASLESELETVVTISKSNSRYRAQELAGAAIAKLWNDSRGITFAMKQTIAQLPNSEAKSHEKPSFLARSREDANPNWIPSRVTSLSNGKVRGKVRLPKEPADLDQKLDFEMVLKDVSNILAPDAIQPFVHLNISASDAGSSPWILGTATVTKIPQSNAKQIEIQLERQNSGTVPSQLKTLHAENGWVSWIQIPMGLCLEPALALTSDGNMITARLIGQTTASWSDSQNMLVELDSKALDILESQIDKQNEAAITQMRSDIRILGTEQMNNELLSLSSRWGQMSDEFSRNHSNWESQMLDLDSRIKNAEAIFKRTSRIGTGSNR